MERATCLPEVQSFFLLAETLTVTLLLSAGVSEMRVRTSPAVSSHSLP